MENSLIHPAARSRRKVSATAYPATGYTKLTLPNAQQQKSLLGGRQDQQGHRKISGRVAEDALGLFYNDLSLRSKLVAIGCWNTIANRSAMFSENITYAILAKVVSKSGGGGSDYARLTLSCRYDME